MRKLALTISLLTAGALAFGACSAVTPSNQVEVPVGVAAPAVVALPSPTVGTTTQPTTTTTTTTIPWERPPFVVSVPDVPLEGIPELEFDLPYGSQGPMVAMLQERLTEARVYRGAIDGEFGEWTAQAVMAFHKVTDGDRVWSWSHEDWDLLAEFTAAFPEDRVPDRVDEPERVEIDITRQLLYVMKGDALEAIIPVSSGNGAQYVNSRGNTVRAKTPRGDFTIQRHIEGLHKSYLGSMWSPWYFRGGYAVHGSSSVPTGPASHGCVRVPKWEAEYLDSVLEVGWPLHVWD